MANCLYNGEDLPNVNSVYTPDVQKDFPFLVMFKLGVTHRRFARACSSRPYYNGSAVIADGAYLASGCNLDDDTPSWVAWEEGENLSQSGVFWTNTDILNSDGTLYLAASEPIPVSAPQLDPLSLLMGRKAGNWVARQRGKA